MPLVNLLVILHDTALPPALTLKIESPENVAFTVPVTRYRLPVVNTPCCLIAYKLSPPPFVTVATPPDAEIDAPESPNHA